MSRRAVGLYSTGGCIGVVLLLALVNVLSARYFFRLDSTENKIYSLSPSSRKLLSQLPDSLPVRVFFDENLPVEYAAQRRYLQELLQEMSAASKGRFRVEFADMKTPEAKEEARSVGIAPLRFTAVRQDKFEMQEGMMGMAMYHGDKREIIPAVTQVSNLEYELVGRIIKLTRPAQPLVGWTSANGEMEPPAELAEYLSRNFDLRRLDILNDTLPALSALVIAGPHSPLSDTALRKIDRAIIAGIPTAILLDMYDVHMGSFFVRKNESGIEKLLKAYGIEAMEGMIVDQQNVPVQMQSRQGMFTIQTLVNYPYIPRVTDFSRDHPVTRTMQEAALPFVTPLSVIDSSGVTVLARSSGESYRIERPFIVSPTQQIEIDNSEQGPFVLGVSVQAARRSAFAQDSAAAPEGDIRLIVLANANFLDEGHGGGPANLIFAANMVDWLSSTDDLISIRSKANTFRPLRKISDLRRNAIKAANLFLMPALVAFAGLARWQIRRVRRRRWEQTLSEQTVSC